MADGNGEPLFSKSWVSPLGLLAVPQGHGLPGTMGVHPEYSQNLPRLVRHAQTKYSSLSVIDVGANVGDTVHFVRAVTRVPILCIEGNPQFVPYLRQNTEGVEDVAIAESFLGDGRMNALDLDTSQDTGHLVAATTDGLAVSVVQLDDVLSAHPAFMTAKILKSDTDGFELRVLMGARRYLEECRPILFLEYDPVYLETQDDTASALREYLSALGYSRVLVYDAFGYLMFSASIRDSSLFRIFDEYLHHRRTTPYADIAVFHEDDEELSHSFEAEEIDHFRQRIAVDTRDFDYSTPEAQAALSNFSAIVTELREECEGPLKRKVRLYEKTLGIGVVPVLVRRAALVLMRKALKVAPK